MSSTPHDQHRDERNKKADTTAPKQQQEKQVNHQVLTPEDNPWLFTAEEVCETPSRLQNLPSDVENRVISKTVTYLKECAAGLTVPQLTVSNAIMFFQRFFMLESMLVHSPPLVAAACLFLACKVQETVKRLRDVIYWTVKVRTRNTRDYPDGMDMDEASPGYFEEKNNILDKEREVLRVLNFDLTIDNPYRHLWLLTRSFIQNNNTTERELQREVTQGAWCFCNDSFRTYVNMRYDPKEVATAALFLSAKLHSCPLPDGTRYDPVTGKRLLGWHELFAVDLSRVEIICNRLLDMYDPDLSKAAKKVANGAGVRDSVPELPPAKRRKLGDTDVSAHGSP